MNYYNEFDPYAAQWLRNLIAAGAIPPGHVDQRSIADVRPGDLTGFVQCHFFAGIAGWSLALKLAGIDPSTPLWTGSCPCQPFSAAGKRKGTEDERHLWPVFRDLIAQCRPPAVLGEQVASADGRAWLAAVRFDMEALGYEVGASDLCAAGIGAPHPRQRLYFVGLADADSQRRNGINPLLWENTFGRHQGETAETSRSGEDDRLADTDSQLHHRRWDAGQGGRHEYPDGSADGGLADAHHAGSQGSHGAYAGAQEREDAARHPGPLRDTSRLANADGIASYRTGCGTGHDCGQFGGAAAVCAESAVSTRGPSPPDSFWSDADWLYCRDGRWRPVEPGTFPLANGIPGRVGRLRAYGNAIVPQVAATFIRAALPERKTD